MTAVLELRNVRAGYGTIDVLHGVNLELEAGQVYALLARTAQARPARSRCAAVRSRRRQVSSSSTA